MDLAHFRHEYTQHGLDRPDLADDPFVQFQKWFEQAGRANLLDPNAMSLSTVGADGRPSSRIVLLKSFDERGLVFYTNYESRKAREIAAHPDVVSLFPWLPLERQVIVEGSVTRTSADESAAYFATRPYGSQLGAWVSAQSSVITTRADLESKLAELHTKFPEGRVPLPPFWGGFRIQPRVWEFWQGRPNRLHDRFRYHREQPTGPWLIERLAP